MSKEKFNSTEQEPNQLKTAVELAMEREGLAEPEDTSTESDNQLKSAAELAMERPAGQTVAMEQNGVEPIDSAQSAAEAVQNIETDSATSEALNAVANANQIIQTGQTANSNEQYNLDEKESTEDDPEEVLSRRRANAMSPTELAGQQRINGAGESNESDEERLRERQLALNEIVLAPGVIRSWRESYAQTFDEEAQTEETAQEFARRRLDQLVNGEEQLISPELQNQMRDFIMMDARDFATYEQSYDEAQGISQEDLTDEAREAQNVDLSVRGSVIVMDKWNELKERTGIKNREGRVAAGLGALATVVAGYFAHRYGVESGVEAAQAEYGAQLSEAQNQISDLEGVIGEQSVVIGEQADVIAEQQDAIDDLGEQAEEAEEPESIESDSSEAEGDVSEQLGLPQDYIEKTPEGYVVTAMPGGETDSIWRAAEHALTDYTGGQPTTEQINALQNQLGDHWLHPGETVNITNEQIENAL